MPTLNQIDTSLKFLISVPDWRPAEATLLQGFSPSLCEKAGLLRFIQDLPTDVFDFIPHLHRTRPARRMLGISPINWHAQSPNAIKSQIFEDDMALTFVFIDRSESLEDYKRWIAACPAPITIIATDGGHIRYDDLSLKTIQERLLNVCKILEEKKSLSGIKDVMKAISSWIEPTSRNLPYKVYGHGSIIPNISALRVAGFITEPLDPFTDLTNEQSYIDQIALTANSILDVRDDFKEEISHYRSPPGIDINIYCPSTYDLKSTLKIRHDADRSTRREFEAAVRMLEKQSGYNFQASSDQQIKAMMGIEVEKLRAGNNPRPNPVILLRQREVALGTEVVSCLASSEFSSVIRLPNRINRTRGAVRQFAQHYRSEHPQQNKRSELFKSVQKAIEDAFSNDFKSLLMRSDGNIRVISDAHVEWLDVRGIPLGLRFNVARIPVTPGNGLVANAAPLPPLQMEAKDLLKVLIVSGLTEDDPVAVPFNVALGHFEKIWQEKLCVVRVRVRCRDELVSAVNEFDGPIMIFDGHGSHEAENAGVLWLGKVPVDVWTLRGEVHRVPPIIILSACDTHAADRNHATAASGFLALGCRSVLGSVFPLDATQAAVFAARLLYRATEYVPTAISLFGRPLTWLEIVSGMLRRQFATDILRHLEGRNFIEPDINLHYRICQSMDLSSGDPFAEMREFILQAGVSEDIMDREIYKATANSSTISYVHLGRPETIHIGPQVRTIPPKPPRNLAD